MNCAEFQRILAVEEVINVDGEEHLRTCAICRELVADLRSIASAVRFLRAEDPSEQVWHRISQELGLTAAAATMSHAPMALHSVESAP